MLSDTAFEFGWSRVEPEVRFGDLCGSLTTQDTLWFYDSQQIVRLSSGNI